MTQHILILPADAPAVNALQRHLEKLADNGSARRTFVGPAKARFHVTINGVEYRVSMRRSPKQIGEDEKKPVDHA